MDDGLFRDSDYQNVEQVKRLTAELRELGEQRIGLAEQLQRLGCVMQLSECGWFFQRSNVICNSHFLVHVTGNVKFRPSGVSIAFTCGLTALLWTRDDSESGGVPLVQSPLCGKASNSVQFEKSRWANIVVKRQFKV
jgi:hypothetical protein